MGAEQSCAAGVEAVRALVRAGVFKRPDDSLGGFSVSWMRRALYGRADHQAIPSRRLEEIMADYGFVREQPLSVIFELVEVD